MSCKCLGKLENNNLPLFFSICVANKRVLNIWGIFSNVVTMVTSLLEIKQLYGNDGIEFSEQY